MMIEWWDTILKGILTLQIEPLLRVFYTCVVYYLLSILLFFCTVSKKFGGVLLVYNMNVITFVVCLDNYSQEILLENLFLNEIPISV
jgi:uncharacterized membrane protein